MFKKYKLNVLELMVIVVLIAVIILLTFFKLDFIANLKDREMITNTLLRLSISLFFIFLLIKENYKSLFKFDKKAKILFIIFPALLISINNFPISAYFNKRASLNGGFYQVILFFIESFSVGLLEELLFRGIVIALLGQLLKEGKNKVIYLLILSSVIFSLFHLANLIDGAVVGDVLLQLGYTFLLGLLWGLIYIKTNNLWLVIILHSLYNFFGEVMFYLGTVNNRWDITTLVLTICLSLVTFIHGIYIFINERKYPNLLFNRND